MGGLTSLPSNKHIMDKKLNEVLNNANKELKNKKIFQYYKIVVDGDFTNKYNQVELVANCHHFPITEAETPEEAIAVIKGYMVGLAHGKDNSYPKLCDKKN